MNMPRYPLVLCGEEADRLTIETLAERTGVHPQRIDCYVEYGLVEPSERVGGRVLFSATCITRVRTIERLRRDVGANLAGIAVILDLVDRLRRVQREVEQLRDR